MAKGARNGGATVRARRGGAGVVPLRAVEPSMGERVMDREPARVSVPALVWADEDAEGWVDCILELSRLEDVSGIVVGGRYRRSILDGLDGVGAGRVSASDASGLSGLLREVSGAGGGDLLVLVAPYRLDPGMVRRGRAWLRSDPRVSAITAWEIGDEARALTGAPAKASVVQLGAVSGRLERRLGALRPVPIAAVHNGIALLGRSAIEVAEGFDPALDARPALSMMEFSVRCQRRGFISVLDPLSVCRRLQTRPLPTTLGGRQAGGVQAGGVQAGGAREELAGRFSFMPDYFSAEAESEDTAFGITRLLARRALSGMSLVVHHRAGHRMSPLLAEVMRRVAAEAAGGSVVVVSDGVLTDEDLVRIPVCPRISVVRSFEGVSGTVDLLFVGVDSVVPAWLERVAKRVVLELHPHRPEDVAEIEARPGRPPDALLTDSPKAVRWLRERSRATPLDRAFPLPFGLGVVEGTALAHRPQIPFGAEFASVPFALCIAPHYNGAAIDEARRALAEAGRDLPLLVIDSLAGRERSEGTMRPVTTPVVVLPRLSSGERAWCRAHAAVVFDHGAKARATPTEQMTQSFFDLCFTILSRQPRSS